MQNNNLYLNSEKSLSMPASKNLQIQLDKMHADFILSQYNEPLEYLRSIKFPIEWRIKKYVKIWRENKRNLQHARKKQIF